VRAGENLPPASPSRRRKSFRPQNLVLRTTHLGEVPPPRFFCAFMKLCVGLSAWLESGRAIVIEENGSRTILYTEFFHPPAQGGTVDAQGTGRPALVAVGHAQGFPESQVFDRPEAWPGFFAGSLRSRHITAIWKSRARLGSASRTIAPP
jgi:hypothetical protein